jgi:glycosyltransferase involved in cell wall biosynthesis
LKRIALALEYPLMQQGGTEVLVRELLRGLSQHFQIVLISGDPDKQSLPANLGRLVHTHLHWIQGPPDSRPARDLAKNLKDQQIELAHFHFGGTYEWASNRIGRCPIPYVADLGVPCVATNHSVMEWLNCGVHPSRSFPYKLLAQAYAWMSRARVLAKLSLEICVSKANQRSLRQMFPLFRSKIGQHYHSLLPDNGAPVREDREPTVLCAGAISGLKGQSILAEAFAQVASYYPEWKLVFVGRTDSSSDEEKIRGCAANNDAASRIILRGAQSHEATLELMQRASIIALPSLREGLGLALQEALYYGCVGVGSRIGGIPELIEHERNGLLVQPGDVSGLRDALQRLMGSQELRARFRARTRPSIIEKGMTAPAMIRNYLQIYEAVRSKRSAP